MSTKRPEEFEPLEEIASLSGRVELLEHELRAWVATARREGVSWSKIGAALGVSKQAAAKRFSAKNPPPAEPGPGLF